MRLYSIQPVFVYDTLASGETFRARPRRDPESWLNDQDGEGPGQNVALAAYEWLCTQMCRRGLERPSPDVFPIWAYQQWAGPAKAKPDLRYGCMRSWGERGRHVLLTLEVPDEKVLLSDYDAWHAVLNYWYLGRASETSAFERLCKSRRLSYYRTKPLPDEELNQQLVNSWQRIFELERMPRLMQYKKADQVVQATFWELAPSQVLEATEFGEGRPSRKLALP